MTFNLSPIARSAWAVVSATTLYNPVETKDDLIVQVAQNECERFSGKINQFSTLSPLERLFSTVDHIASY